MRKLGPRQESALLCLLQFHRFSNGRADYAVKYPAGVLQSLEKRGLVERKGFVCEYVKVIFSEGRKVWEFSTGRNLDETLRSMQG